jgi:hypothetical protein
MKGFRRESRIFNLALGIPSGREWSSDFALSVVMLALALKEHVVQGYDAISLKIINKRSSILAQSRSEIVELALRAGCDHLLFVDSDQTFPSHTAHVLARHRKPVVAANVAIKAVPSQPTARGKSEKWHGGDVIYTRPDSKGIEQVWRIGCGVMMIDLRIMKDLPKPWFQVMYDEATGTYRGEDWYFCEQLEKAGIPIFIDHDLSKHIGHVGDYEYTHDVVGEIVSVDENGCDAKGRKVA